MSQVIYNNTNDNIYNIFEKLSICSIVIEFNGTIVEANRVCSYYFELPSKSIIGKNIKSIIPDSYNGNLFSDIDFSETKTLKRIIIYTSSSNKKKCALLHLCVLSFESQLAFIALSDYIDSNINIPSKSEIILHEIKMLRPYLNKYGVEKLDNILQLITPIEFNRLTHYRDIINSGKIESIKMIFPNLSNQEYMICQLLMSRLNTKEIAIILDSNSNAIRVAISRMLRKIGVSTRDEFVESLNNKLSELS